MLKMKTIHDFRKKILVDLEEGGPLPSLLPAVASKVGCLISESINLLLKISSAIIKFLIAISIVVLIAIVVNIIVIVSHDYRVV